MAKSLASHFVMNIILRDYFLGKDTPFPYSFSFYASEENSVGNYL